MHHHQASYCYNFAKEDAVSVYIQHRREHEPFLHEQMHVYLLLRRTM